MCRGEHLSLADQGAAADRVGHSVVVEVDVEPDLRGELVWLRLRSVDDLSAELVRERCAWKRQANHRDGGPYQEKKPHLVKLEPILGSRKGGDVLP